MYPTDSAVPMFPILVVHQYIPLAAADPKHPVALFHQFPTPMTVAAQRCPNYLVDLAHPSFLAAVLWFHMPLAVLILHMLLADLRPHMLLAVLRFHMSLAALILHMHLAALRLHMLHMFLVEPRSHMFLADQLLPTLAVGFAALRFPIPPVVVLQSIHFAD
jgi:hypothetical protein